MTDIAVTDRLATGLARYAIRRWKDQVQSVARHVEAARAGRPTTGKGLRKLVREMRHAYEPSSFETFTHEWRATAPAQDLAMAFGLICRVPPSSMTDALVGALERHTWLRTPYTERRDYLSEMWEAAREQSRVADPDTGC